MAITRQKKENIVEEGKKDFKESGVVMFTDYKGTSVADLGSLRVTLSGLDAKMKVIKKRLLKIILAENGVSFDPNDLDGQVATVFAKGDVSDIAGPVYEFAKTHEGFQILGGIDAREKVEIPRDIIIKIGTLPPRNVLLAKVVGSIAAPLRGFVYVLSERSKQ